MTGEEREVLRQLVSDKIRERVDQSMIRGCGRCGNEFEAVRVHQKFCCERCRKQAWHRTDKGRVWRAAKKREWRARQRARQAAFAEIRKIVADGGSLDDVLRVVEEAA